MKNWQTARSGEDFGAGAGIQQGKCRFHLFYLQKSACSWIVASQAKENHENFKLHFLLPVQRHYQRQNWPTLKTTTKKELRD